jgi:RNA polymerase sigma factor (sigma-70 family)
MDPLETYAQTRDDRAFRALVDTHLGLVYGTAMRRLGDPELSEEVTQNVFNILAKKAKAIRSGAALPAWLHRATILECSKAIRGEARRRKRMQKLIEITSLEGDGLAAWKHAQADLDEAVDELPAADRDILFQRFYEDKSFCEIAQQSGKTEAASQKQASRAIAKLTELMRARGFAVPAAVLASGLGAELCKAAPAKLAATISSTALAGTASSSISLFGIMSITKSTAVGATVAALVIAAFTGGGYLKGRNAAKDRLANEGASAKPETIVSSSAKAPAGRVTATPAQTRGSVREILQAAADYFAQIGEDRSAQDKAEREIAKLRPDEIEAALAELALLDVEEDARDRTRWEIVEHWASWDGKAAAEYVLATSPGELFQGMTSALYGWGKHSPEEAYAWYLERLAGGSAGTALKSSALKTVMRSWAAKDSKAALNAMAQLSYDEQRSLTHSMDRLVREQATREPYLAALVDYESGPVRVKLIEEAVDEWGKLDPPAAAAWLDTVEFEIPEQALSPTFELAESWFERDPRAAIDWAWPKTPEGLRAEFVSDFVRREWAKRDKVGANAWLKANGFEEEK